MGAAFGVCVLVWDAPLTSIFHLLMVDEVSAVRGSKMIGPSFCEGILAYPDWMMFGRLLISLLVGCRWEARDCIERAEGAHVGETDGGAWCRWPFSGGNVQYH